MDSIPFLLGILSATLGLAAFMSLRNRNERRDAGLLLGTGIGFGAVTVAVLLIPIL